MAGIDFFNKVAALAEDEGHHPDLHLEGYRNLSIAIWTHAAGGLTENDFILAAKIDQIGRGRHAGKDWQDDGKAAVEFRRQAWIGIRPLDGRLR